MSLLIAFALCVQDKAAAEKALDEIAAAMKDAAAVGFELRFKYEDQTYTTKVTLKRPNLARIEDEQSITVLDGKAYWYYVKESNEYMTVGQTDDFAPTISSPLSELYFGHALLENAAAASADPEKRTVTWRIEDEGASTEYKIWTDEKKAVIRFTTTYADEGEEPSTQEMEVAGFTTSPAVAGDAFAFSPPEGSTVMDTGGGDLEASLLAVGADAPDFEAPGLDDAKFKLSSLKGKVVLLNFWFHG